MTDRAERGGGKVTSFDPGIIARVSRAMIGAVRGASDAWFGPGQPNKQVAPEGTPIRQFDYRFGANMTYAPRAEEAINFDQLRALANYDIVRLAIETVKNQIERVPFNIKPRGANSLGGKAGRSAESDPRVDKIEAFFISPDGEHDWPTWLRGLIEEMLVTDAAAIYPQMTNGGDLLALELVDGATIKRVIDERGRTPLPPSPAYQQIVKGAVAGDYTRDTLIYRPRNYRVNKVYGFSPVEQIIMTVNIGLRREMKQLAFFTDGNMTDVLVGTPQGWTQAMIAEWQDWWNSQMRGNPSARSAGRFVPGEIASNVHEFRPPPLKDEFDEWLARIVMYAFNLPNTNFVKQNNRAVAETQQAAALDEGLAPLLVWVKSIMDSVIARYFRAPDLEFIWADQKELDPKVAADIDNGALDRGAMCIDEYRAKRGQDPLPNGLGAEYLIKVGSTVIRVKDAIKEPEPKPSPLIGHNGGPSLDPDAGNEGQEGDEEPTEGEVAKTAPVPFSKGRTPM